jgi:flagellar basal body-associated protein FliL
MEKTNEKHSYIILIFLIIFIMVLTGLGYHFRQEINFADRLKGAKNRIVTHQEVCLTFDITASIGDESLRVRYSVPCKSLKQKRNLAKKLPGIKNEMLMVMSSPEMIESLQQRDFKLIKKYSLRTVNYYTDSKDKINNIYVECFFLN